MRRIITTAVAVALVGGAALSAPAVAADNARPTGTGTVSVPSPADALDLTYEDALPSFDAPSAGEALITAKRVMNGNARKHDPSMTLALRDLFMKRSELRGKDRELADAMLARPTDGAGDPQGFGYTVPEAAPLCNARLCLHYVTTGPDAATPEWAAYSLAMMDQIWTAEVDDMGYRAPLSDGNKGGGPQFDVYLKDIGPDIYGFCAGESRVQKRTASGYCVLDNDFSNAQFPNATPEDNLHVTAAHEFFHAIQYAYDYAEDPWMMESTATWMEERQATNVNDNRQYFPYSQIYAPYVPLDMFSRSAGFQYGNWVFWEYLSTKYGNKIVKQAWQEAGSLKKDGGKNSLEALQKILKKKGGFAKVYATFAAGNLTPAAIYPEGGEYDQPGFRGAKQLKKKKSKTYRVKVNHLSSASYLFAPGKGTSSKKTKLAVSVNGPAKRTSPLAVVVVHLANGKRQVKYVKLNRNGDGRIKVKFSSKKVLAVTATLVNASTRYKCNKRTVLSCQGIPLDDKARFAVTGRVTK
jgi:hypothetical protein